MRKRDMAPRSRARAPADIRGPPETAPGERCPYLRGRAGSLSAMLRLARQEPSALRLAAQLAAVLLYPFLEGNGAGRAAFSVLGILILGLVLLAVPSTPALTWIAVSLGLPATVLLLIQAVTGSDELLPYSSALEAILYFYAAVALIMYMLADHEVTRDELFAVGATFTLVAWAFAYTYTVCQAI